MRTGPLEFGEPTNLDDDALALDADQMLALSRLDAVFRGVDRRDVAVTSPVVGHFELRRVLGEGTFGVVYEAIDRRNGQQVAVKIARSNVQLDPQARERFLKEARIAARLIHPNIARIMEAGDDHGVLYLVVEYCPGCTLDRWAFTLSEQGKYVQVARMLAQVARAVDVGHRNGVIHRDLKPQNILVDRTHPQDPVPVVLDFGLAYASEDLLRQTSSSVLLGTPLYTSPERLTGREEAVTAGCDIFALGAILYECLVGVSPFDAPTLPEVFERIQLGQFKPPRSTLANLPPALEAICLKCLRYDARHRYCSALVLAEDLEAFASGRPVQAKMPSRLESLAWFFRRRQLPRELSLLLIAVNGLVLAWAIVNFPLAMLLLPQSAEQSSSQLMYLPVVAAIIPVHGLLLAMSFRLYQGRQSRRGVLLHLALTVAIAMLAVLLICVPAPLTTLTRFEKVGALGLVASFAEFQTLLILMVLWLGTFIRRTT